MTNNTLILFLFVFVAIGCNENSLSSPIEGFHTNGKLSYRYTVVDEKRHGLYQEFYPNGKLQIERIYDLDSIISEKIIDINGEVLVNYIKRDGELYGLLGSSECMSVNTRK